MLRLRVNRRSRVSGRWVVVVVVVRGVYVDNVNVNGNNKRARSKQVS